MNTQLFIDSKAPESYNQGCWLDLSQRLAWLLKRELNASCGDPYFYFNSLQAPCFIDTNIELNVLFSGDYYHGEQFVTRYIEKCYWVIYKCEVNNITYFFVMCIDDFSEEIMSYHSSQPRLYNKRQLVAQRKQIETYLIDVEQQGEKCTYLAPYRLPNTVATSNAVYAQLSEKNTAQGQKTKMQPRHVNLYANKLAYQLPLSLLKSLLPGVITNKEGRKMWDQEQYIKAWGIASSAHNTQFMQGSVAGSKIPYINHISLVTMEVMSAIAQSQTEKESLYQPITDPDLAVVCALLHDTIEDTEVTFDDIIESFDETIAQGVLALTKNTNLPTKREQMLDSLARIKAQPLEISMVKLADRITNLQPPPHYWSKEKINNYREEATLILEELGNANEYLAHRLANKIEAYQQYC